MGRLISDRLNLFFEQFKQFDYKKHEIILRPYDMPSGIFYLQKGYVRAYSTSREGKELTIIIFKPEDVFPYSWAISNIQNKYYYEAMTLVEVRRVSKEELLNFINNNPDILFTLSNRIVVRMMGLAQRMEYLVFGNAYKKVASILLICAERFGIREKNNVAIQVPLTHKDIASLVGVTRETASIEMKKLEKRELIMHQGRFMVVKDMNRLKKESLFDDLE